MALNPTPGMVFWLTGLSGSGKTTLSKGVDALLRSNKYSSIILDGDILRSGLCSDLGFTEADRRENNRRAAELAKFLISSGHICICALISPSQEFRERARQIIGSENFREVYISCPIEVCETRDVKGYYKRSRAGKVKNFTGIDSFYEVPLKPDMVVDSATVSIEESTSALLNYIEGQILEARKKAAGESGNLPSMGHSAA